MDLDTRDLHMILNQGSRTLKLFAAGGQLVMECEARNRTVLDDGNYGHWSPCPPGEYVLGFPVAKNTVPFGHWFIPMGDYNGHHAMAEHGRAGIGIHSGGSGLKDPFAPRQGWVITHGCFRIQGEDLDHLVQIIKPAHAVGGVVYVTVEPPSPSAADLTDDDIVVDESDLDPEE